MGNPSWEERINAVENKYSVWQLIWVAAKLSCCVALAWLFASFIWSCLASWTATTSTTAAATRRQLDRRPDHLPHFQQEQRSITVYASTAVPLSVQGIVNQIQRQLGAPRHAWSLFRIDPSGNVAFTDSTKVPIPDTLEQFRSWVFVSYSLDEIVKYLHWMDMVSRRDSMVAIPQWKVHFQNALWNDWLAISTLQLKVCPEFSASTKNTNRWTIGVRDDDLRFDKVRQRFLDNAAAAARKKLPVLQRRQRHGASEKTIVAHSWERSLRYVEQMLQKANALTQNATGQWNEMREMMR